jgi:hypothetical protein
MSIQTVILIETLMAMGAEVIEMALAQHLLKAGQRGGNLCVR